MALKLDGERLKESVSLQRMDRRGGGLDSVVLVIGEAERRRFRRAVTMTLGALRLQGPTRTSSFERLAWGEAG